MFKLDFLSLVKEYNNSQSDEEKEKVMKKILKLIEENKEEYNSLIEQGFIDENIVNDINQYYQKNINNNSTTNNTSNDYNQQEVERILNAYKSWLNEYSPDNEPSQNMKKIVEDIVKYYAPRRMDILTKVFNINDSPEFEAFKTHIKNNLRGYFLQKILDYTNSQEYEKLNFLQKYKKNKEIKKVINKINSYDFNQKEIKETINNT